MLCFFPSKLTVTIISKPTLNTKQNVFQMFRDHHREAIKVFLTLIDLAMFRKKKGKFRFQLYFRRRDLSWTQQMHLATAEEHLMQQIINNLQPYATVTNIYSSFVISKITFRNGNLWGKQRETRLQLPVLKRASSGVNPSRDFTEKTTKRFRCRNGFLSEPAICFVSLYDSVAAM